MQHIDYTIDFEADWHIGTGTGRHGHLDRTYDRDEHGLPFVGAKSLKGVLRTGCERIALGLDNGTPGEWMALTDWIFGTQPAAAPSSGPKAAPRAGAIVVDRATLAPEVTAAIHARPGLRRALSVERPGVMLDDLGVAADDHLRFIEMAPAGVVLHGRCSLPSDAPPAAIALVAAALSELRQLGHRRRRGWGRCRVTLQQPGLLDLAALAAPAPRITAAEVAPSAPTDGLANVETLTRYRITLRAVSPLLLPAAKAGNDVASRSTIPGSSLLALFGGIAPRATAAAVASGSLRVGEATPLVNGSDSLPVPLSWFRAKEADLRTAVPLHHRLDDHSTPAQQLQQVRHGFVATAASDRAAIGTVRTARRMHVAIDDSTLSAQDQALFSYVVVVPGTEYSTTCAMSPQTAHAIAAESGATSINEALEGDFRVGASRRNDYGRVRVVAVEEVPSAAPAPSTSDSFTVWLTSDLLAVDDTLQPNPTADGLAHALSQALGRPVEVAQSFVRRSRRESWHSRWGLPRPSLVGVAAGSVALCRMADGEAVPLSDLAELGHRGVGDRTGEGFGRFEVNHPLLTATQMVSASDLPPSPPPAGTLAGVDAAVLQGLEARSMELFITERVELALAGDIQSNWLHLEKKNPGNSQLGGLRAAVRSDDGSLATVKAWWGSMTAVPRRSNRWPDATKKAVHALLGNPSDVWKLLGVSDADLSAIGGPHSAETKQRHTNAAVLALLAGCMRAGQRGNHDHAEAAHDGKESN